jgi:hypothetical protein
MRSKNRKSQKTAIQSKEVHDYDWMGLVNDGKIGKLSVPELNNYLSLNNLPVSGKKPDKMRTIIAHLSSDFLRGQTTVQVHADSDEEVVSELCSDNEEMI